MLMLSLTVVLTIKIRNQTHTHSCTHLHTYTSLENSRTLALERGRERRTTLILGALEKVQGCGDRLAVGPEPQRPMVQPWQGCTKKKWPSKLFWICTASLRPCSEPRWPAGGRHLDQLWTAWQPHSGAALAKAR